MPFIRNTKQTLKRHFVNIGRWERWEKTSHVRDELKIAKFGKRNLRHIAFREFFLIMNAFTKYQTLDKQLNIFSGSMKFTNKLLQ